MTDDGGAEQEIALQDEIIANQGAMMDSLVGKCERLQATVAALKEENARLEAALAEERALGDELASACISGRWVNVLQKSTWKRWRALREKA